MKIDFQQSVQRIIAIWLALVALLAMTVAGAFIPMGIGNTVLSLGLATAKAALVVVFYMELRHSSVFLRVIAAVSVFAISLLFILGGLDFFTRITYLAPWQHAVPSLSSQSQ